MGKKVIITIPAQKFEVDLENLCGEDWNDDEIYDYVIHPTVQDAESDWEVVED